MPAAFADTCYYWALLNPRDDLHRAASDLARSLDGYRIYTSELVIVELLNLVSALGPHVRETTSGFVREFADANTVVVPFSSVRLRAAQSHYDRHRDKEWSLTDCDSMLVMAQQGIQEALTHDHHFRQAGYTILL